MIDDHHMFRDEIIASLIEQLAQAAVADDAYNQYAEDGQAGQGLRRANLELYLRRTLDHGPDLVIVGEAPGYLGCRRTGVPFTSDRLLLANDGPSPIFGVAHGFQQASSDGRMPGEQTATIVWRTLKQHNVVALGWNAWPFHPHRPDRPDSNRPPRAGELRAGLPFLATILALVPSIPVVAMGNSAAHNLAILGAPFTKVRHPAQGGARQFADGIASIVAEVLQRSVQAGTIATQT